ncbi:MAG: hypothetical protein ABH811_01895 [archaeon]
MFRKRGIHKNAQIWVETVIYTLIALVMIGAVLSIVKPKIEEGQDKAIVEQSAEMLKGIDSIISDIKKSSGNQRLIELAVKKGNLIIDGENERIIFEIQSKYQYSEPGLEVSDEIRGMTVLTTKVGNLNNVTLVKDYTGEFNLNYFSENRLKTISKSPTSYKMILSNEGKEKIVGPYRSCTYGIEFCTDYPVDEYNISCTSTFVCEYISKFPTINIEVN